MSHLEEKLSYLRLVRSENISRSIFFRLINIFDSAQNALEHLDDYILTTDLKRRIKLLPAAIAEKELADSEDFGSEIITFADKKYPKLLRQISDPPPILTIKGRSDLFNQDSIAIVGPRNASFNATSLARKIASQLGENSIVTVSGLARGIDAASHESSISTGTIAVIAGGINNIYPKENHLLFDKITSEGLLVSENPFNSPPKGGLFVKRNRIISGLSLGTIVVEASLRSGTLITARFTLEQGRELFAVPGSPSDPRCHGANRLIKNGAKLFEDINDIINELPHLKRKFGSSTILREPDSPAFISPVSKIPDAQEIKEIRNEIYQKLGASPVEIEAIILELQAPAKFINIALVQLELEDKIVVNLEKVMLKPGNS